MLSRAQFVSALMIVVLGIFLLCLYLMEKISVIGILGIITIGVFFVIISHYFYKNYWNDEE